MKVKYRESFCSDSEQAADLARRLTKFYQASEDYVAFQEPSCQLKLWSQVARRVSNLLEAHPDRKVSILEVGAGRSGLARYFSEIGIRSKVHLHAQDVTPRNAEWLAEHFDSLTIGPVEDVSGRHDVVLSTQVLEHVTDPRRFLDELWHKTETAGAVFIMCPRYDFPFYLPRSADHLSIFRRLALSIQLLGIRLWTVVSGRAAWLVHRDPAVFHMPFFRDRDAVHWVSLFDIRAYWPDLQILKLDHGGFKDAILVRLLTVGIVRERH